MGDKLTPEAAAILDERFHHDCEIALATLDGERPSVRTVNAFYEDGSFYSITWAKSGKMRQIGENPKVGVCGDWFQAHGVGEDLGPVGAPENQPVMEELRKAFAAWYDNGHTEESDPDTHLLRVRLTDGVLFSHGTRYDIDFTK